MLESSLLWPTPRPRPHAHQWILQPCPGWFTYSPGSRTHQWELQLNRGIPRVLSPGLFPTPGLAHPHGCSDPAWCGPLTVLAPDGGLGVDHNLSWFSCVPAGAEAWPSPAYSQTWPTQMLENASALHGLVHPSCGSCAPQRELWLNRGVPQVPYQACSQSWILCLSVQQ